MLQFEMFSAAFKSLYSTSKSGGPNHLSQASLKEVIQSAFRNLYFSKLEKVQWTSFFRKKYRMTWNGFLHYPLRFYVLVDAKPNTVCINFAFQCRLKKPSNWCSWSPSLFFPRNIIPKSKGYTNVLWIWLFIWGVEGNYHAVKIFLSLQLQFALVLFKTKGDNLPQATVYHNLWDQKKNIWSINHTFTPLIVYVTVNMIESI